MARQDSATAARNRQLAALKEARADYARARLGLVAAEETYARARLAFERAQAGHDTEAWVPAYHYTCGHPGARAVSEHAGKLLILCPACRQLDQRGALSFTQVRGLLLPERQ